MHYHSMRPFGGSGIGTAHATSEARRAHNEANRLREEVNRLLLILEALWELMRSRHPELTDDALVRTMAAIDMRDGQLDGVVEPGPPETCSHCGRVLPGVRPICLYCGKRVARNPFAR